VSDEEVYWIKSTSPDPKNRVSQAKPLVFTPAFLRCNYWSCQISSNIKHK